MRRLPLKQPDDIRIIISGGGTGGHIFPALAIADEIMRRKPETDILFVGALGRMEMEKVPAAGYKIIGLPVSGFQRKLSLKNLLVIWNLLRSIVKAGKIISDFQPDVVIGVGGYASGPVLRTAASRGIPTLIQEQNSYAGITNKLLARKASTICVAYHYMEKYFPVGKIHLTGNPVRTFNISEKLRHDGLKYFDLRDRIPVILVIGGSLGAATINEAMLNGTTMLIKQQVQVIWQTGKYYINSVQKSMLAIDHENIRIYDFISRMDLAYNVADLVISRAGAISISEICLVGKASILVPSPNVAEDHQTKNAKALLGENAAEMISDKDAKEQLVLRALELVTDHARCHSLSINSKRLAKPDATSRIVDEVFKLIED
jgi:UDP-N-acetylglucosamine--N-acetylmuramyl-(pentapeptide) pyrophosphoryl-undecaprenol N-acetylglucosamine transferase